jgi:hypothetical protein
MCPFAPVWSGRKVGGRVTRPMPTSGRANVAPQHNPQLSPRSPVPAKPDAFLTSAKVINTESMVLGSGPNQGQAWNLPTLGDITGFTFSIAASSATGSGSVTVEWANAIDHIVVRNRNGTPYDTIYFSDPGLAGGLKARIYDWDTLFVLKTPTSVRANTTAASTALTSITKTIVVPGLRCSAEDGPWQLEVWYSGTTEFGGTGVTAATITNRIKVHFGTADDGTGQKWNTKFAQQTIPTSGTGDFHLETTGIIKNTLINQMLLQNVATLSHLDHMVVNSRGANIDTNLSEAEIVQGMTDNFYNSFLSTTLAPMVGSPALNNQFTIGDNDELILNYGTSESNDIVAYQYLLPAGDAY